MTTKQIDAAQAREAVKFSTAKAIREVLDKARKGYGEQRWDDEEAETTVLDMVTGEGDDDEG